MSRVKKAIYPILRWTYHRLPGPFRRVHPRAGAGPGPVHGLWLLAGAAPDKALARRALVSYRILPPEAHKNTYNGVFLMAKLMTHALNELGYTVDVVDYRDAEFIPRRDYALFIGHGGYNYERIASKLRPDTLKIYFSSGCYWKFNNEQERARLAGVQARRGVSLPPERSDISEEWACSHADAIISLGNEFTRKSYHRFRHVVTLNAPSYHDDHFEERIRRIDFATARRNFLFFAGSGNVHKGLDLLLEAFSAVGDACNLYICQNVSPEFHAVYRHELEDIPNITLAGFLPLRGAEYYRLIDRCAFVILPSCSEGQPISVVECMHQGLIPVVSREAGVSTCDFGITLKNCSIEEIAATVKDLSQRPSRWYGEMSQKVRNAALAGFSETAFRDNMKKSIEKAIMDYNKAETAGCA